MALLATQADFEKYGHVDITAEPDASVTARLESASAIIESYCRRVFTSATVTAETHDGGMPSVFLRQPPVTSITTVVENGVTLTSADYLLYPERGRLLRMKGGYPSWWYWKPQNVVITYVGGYTPIPFDVRLVCVRIAERAFKAAAAWAASPAGAEGFESERIGDYEYQYGDAVTTSVSAVATPLTDEDREILNPYRLLQFGVA